MKKILYLLAFGFLSACSTKKDAFLNRTYQGFTSYYNTLFHGKEALKSELYAKKKDYKDNFYGGYIEVFTQNALATTSEDEGIQNMASQFFGTGAGSIPQSPIGSSNFQRAEEKALKVIEKKSMLFRGIEKNKEIFNAYLLLAEARIYQGKLFEALEALNQIYLTMPSDKKLPLAKIYEGLIYSKMKNFIRAEEIFLALDRDTKLKKEYRKLLSVYYADNLIYTNRKEEAIEQLDLAFRLNKSREIKSRIAFLRGQILVDLNRKEEARSSFAQSYKYANDFEFEVKSQIEIAKTFSEGDDYDAAKKYFEKISKKGIYASRKNEFYYAIGLIANKSGKKEEAQEFFQKSIGEKVSDNNIRGLAYFEIGQLYFAKEDYIRSGAYYDSALVVMENEPMKMKIEELSANIKNVSRNYYLVKKNDSILNLVKMSEAQRIDFFQKYIDDLKDREEKIQRKEAEKAKKNRKMEIVDFTIDTNFADFVSGFDTQKSNKFYFSNQTTIAKGSLEFKKIWGNRALGDNWRSAHSEAVSLDDIENKALGRGTVADARRFEIAYYTEKIPTDNQAVLNLKKERDTASLGLGRMYEAYFQNTSLATKTLYDLIDEKPDDEIKLQALYLIFSMNFEKNIDVAEKAKSIILREFPYTPYAEFVKNPRRMTYTQSEDEVKKVYQQAYTLFTENKFEEAKKLINEAINKYSKDALLPKFELLNAFITGKTVGKEIMILQLQQMVFNYEKTPEGVKAKEILAYLNTDLDNPVINNSEENNHIDSKEQNTVAEPETLLYDKGKDDNKSQKKSIRKEDKKKQTEKLQRPVYTWEMDYLKPEE